MTYARREDLLGLDKFIYRTLIVRLRADDARIVGIARNRHDADIVIDRLLDHAGPGDVFRALTVCDSQDPPWWKKPEALRERLAELLEST